MNNYRNRIHSLKGSPFEIGFIMGRTLGPRLETNIERYYRQRVPLDARLNEGAWRSGALSWLRNLPDRFLKEYEGLAGGANLPLQRVAEWAYLDHFLDNQCSGGILTIDGKAWVIRNNDMYAPDLWGYASIRQVTGRIPIISFGMEGDVFTPTGINQEKLWLHYNYVDKLDSSVAGHPHLPAYAWIVEALETCGSLKDVEALLDRIQRDEGMILFAVDGKTEEFAIYECTCTQFHKRIPAQGWLVGTNHYCTYTGSPPPLSAEPLDTTSRYHRMETLVERARSRAENRLLVQELIRILADDAVERRTGEVITAYSNVACPGTQEIWYTFGGYPAASQGDWHKLDLPW